MVQKVLIVIGLICGILGLLVGHLGGLNAAQIDGLGLISLAVAMLI